MPRYQNGNANHHQHHRYSREFDIDDEIDDSIFSYNNLNANYNFGKTGVGSSSSRYNGDLDSPTGSPTRDSIKSKSTIRFDDEDFDARPNPDDMLKMKWIDYGPRMSRLRDQRTKRLMNRLEQFEEWDAEQAQKQRQFELAREQRHQNILDRLKTQDFCVDQMLRRHESDIETTRELDTYVKEHLFVEASPDPVVKQGGPINEFRKFEAEMNEKLKILEDEIDSLNPRYKIEQSLLPRLERARDSYSIEPEVYTARGKRVLKRPKLNGLNDSARSSEDRNSKSLSHGGYYGEYDFDDDYKGIKYYFPTALNSHDLYDRARLQYNLDKLKPQELTPEKKASPVKPIITNKKKGPSEFVVEIPAKPASPGEKHVVFKDDIVEEPEKQSTAVNGGNVEDELASEMVVKQSVKETPVQGEQSAVVAVVVEVAPVEVVAAAVAAEPAAAS